MRLIVFLALIIPNLVFAQSRGNLPEAALRSAIAMLRRAVANEPDEPQFLKMLEKVRRVRLDHSGTGKSCVKGAAAYVSGGLTIFICPNFYRAQNLNAARFMLLHELAHLTTGGISFTFKERPDWECLADYWAYRVHDAVGAAIGPSGYDQRCGGSSRNWRPPRDD
jgi:hypothetical protein